MTTEYIDRAKRPTSQLRTLPGPLAEVAELQSSPLTVVDAIRLCAFGNCLYVTESVNRDECITSAKLLLPAEWWWVAAWSLAGQTTGHAWMACDACGEARLMRPRRHKCITGPVGTYRLKRALCEGSMQLVAKPPRRSPALKRLLEGRN